jgi:hypothetical protein
MNRFVLNGGNITVFQEMSCFLGQFFVSQKYGQEYEIPKYATDQFSDQFSIHLRSSLSIGIITCCESLVVPAFQPNVIPVFFRTDIIKPIKKPERQRLSG